jgi:hypothetical protein
MNTAGLLAVVAIAGLRAYSADAADSTEIRDPRNLAPRQAHLCDRAD